MIVNLCGYSVSFGRDYVRFRRPRRRRRPNRLNKRICPKIELRGIRQHFEASANAGEQELTAGRRCLPEICAHPRRLRLKNLRDVTERKFVKFVKFVDLKFFASWRLGGKTCMERLSRKRQERRICWNFRVFRGQKFPCLGLRNRGVNAAQPFIHQGLPRQMNTSLIPERGNGVLSLIKPGLRGEIGGETCCGRIFEEATRMSPLH